MALNVSIVANPKLAGVALIVGVSVWGIGHLISVVRGDKVRISKDGYSAACDKKVDKMANNKICEVK